MTLPPLPPLNWEDEIASAAEAEMKCVATFYESNAGNPPTLTELFSTKARFQHLRSPVDASNATSWSTKRAARIQIPLNATTGMIRRGLIVRITAGTEPLRDPTIGLVSFVVQSAINSSNAAVRTIEVTTDGVEVGS